ncbi:MAG: hypothetical protein IPI35_17680 [Deltaproteobacteria bacterium]|nr:hypothetical protein [Deltaproteobacteria bacterium]
MDPTRIIHRVAVVESGGSYAAQNRNSDGAGLAFGLLQWTQRSGSLGALLKTMSKADPTRFSQVFGADAGRLLTVTTASEEATRMSLPLWAPPWTARFAAAGAAPSLQRAQLRHAQTGVEWKATLEIMALFNLHTERAATLAFDRAVQQGPNGAKGIARRLHAALIAEGLVLVEPPRSSRPTPSGARRCFAAARRQAHPAPRGSPSTGRGTNTRAAWTSTPSSSAAHSPSSPTPA